ncbi:hypothetical protein SAMN05421835_107229 [Amycolatopsis sacchari]|uniref:Uncharacterized protein n=1 Tax=Amycolatopsis sacchari TaxID=115433 RepID=A0A1I3TF93_9PSEU|nr:hypothetical protein [Amycolatopsis sacchari]SFJ68127.1 hypothetical protein SAMN05421835_107229 [Amycolatopsis sacchari]
MAVFRNFVKCTCGYRRRRRTELLQRLKPVLIGGLVVLAILAAVRFAKGGNLVDVNFSALVTSSTLVLGFVGFVAGVMGIRLDHQSRWRDLDAPAWLGILVFAFSFSKGWAQYFESEISGVTRVVAVSVMVVLAAVTVGVVLVRAPTRMREFRRDYLTIRTSSAQPFNLKAMRYQREAMVHLIACIEPQCPKRAEKIREKKVRETVRSRSLKHLALRRYSGRQLVAAPDRNVRVAFAVLMIARALVSPYEQVGAWTAAFFGSSTILLTLFGRVPPSLLSSGLVFLPFVLVPVIHAVREMLLRILSMRKPDGPPVP